MPRFSTRWLSPVTALLFVTTIAGSLSAQRVAELGLHAVATFSATEMVGAGGYGAMRLGDRLRIAVTAAAGTSEGETAFRGEALAHFLISPHAMSGVGVYGLGGVAVANQVFKDGNDTRGLLVLGLGIEAKPGAGSGWALEAGIGGGFRVGAGYRWRWPT